MTQWIIGASDGFTDVGLLRISESVWAYAYLILSSQASAMSSVLENMASALTAQSAFLNNFENVVNHRVDIREDLKCYQDTLSYASSKVDYSVLFMLPGNMTLKIKTGNVGYNNKIIISDGNFILGKNEKVNLAVPAMKSHKTNSLETPAIKNHKTTSLETPAIESHSITTQGLTHAPTISYENEKTALILFITGGFTLWFF